MVHTGFILSQWSIQWHIISVCSEKSGFLHVNVLMWSGLLDEDHEGAPDARFSVIQQPSQCTHTWKHVKRTFNRQNRPTKTTFIPICTTSSWYTAALHYYQFTTHSVCVPAYTAALCSKQPCNKHTGEVVMVMSCSSTVWFTNLICFRFKVVTALYIWVQCLISYIKHIFHIIWNQTLILCGWLPPLALMLNWRGWS